MPHMSKSPDEIAAEEEEILKKYGSKDSEEDNDVEPGKLNQWTSFFSCYKFLNFLALAVNILEILVLEFTLPDLFKPYLYFNISRRMVRGQICILKSSPHFPFYTLEAKGTLLFIVIQHN